MASKYRDFREWLREEEVLGNVLRITAPIKCGDPNSIVDAVPAEVKEEWMRVINNPGANGKNMETELKALGRYLHSIPSNPIGIIENPVNNAPGIPIIINPWPTRDRALSMCGCSDKEEFIQKYKELKNNTIPPIVVAKDEAPVKEVIVPEDRVDLYEVPRNWVEFETIPWSPTGGSQFVVFDPETNTHDLGEWRAGFLEWENGDPDKSFSEERRKRDAVVTLIYEGSQESDGGRYYRENYRKKNKPMPAAFAMCSDPAIIAVAGTRSGLEWPEDGADEYSVAGGFMGEPVRVVPAETIPGLMVPAHAEWVFEGEFLPEELVIPEYSEGISVGSMLGGHQCPIFRVKCITHRKNPLWCQTWSSNGLDHDGVHRGLTNLVIEADAINYLRQSGYAVKDVVNYDTETIVVQSAIDGAEKRPYYGKTLLMATYACPNGYIGIVNKYYIAVGPDINPNDPRDVIWAMNNRSQPVSDSVMIKEGLASWGDPTGKPGPLGWKGYGEQMFIDALIKVPERFSEFAPRTDPVSWELEAIKRMKEKLG